MRVAAVARAVTECFGHAHSDLHLTRAAVDDYRAHPDGNAEHRTGPHANPEHDRHAHAPRDHNAKHHAKYHAKHHAKRRAGRPLHRGDRRAGGQRAR